MPTFFLKYLYIYIYFTYMYIQVQRIRACLEVKQDCTAILLNYRSDGSEFLNRIEMTHLMDKDGKTPFIVGLQCKVS